MASNSAVVGILRVLLTMDSAEFQKSVESAQKNVGKFEKSMLSTGRQLTAVGSALTKALTLPILGLGAGLAKVGLDFDRATDQIRAATGATGAALDGLTESFKTVLVNVPASVDEVATAIGDLHTRTGATGSQLEAMAEQMLNLARIGRADVASVIAASTRAFGDWSIATEDQSAALDFLFKTSQSTGIGVTRLTDLVVQFGAPLRALGFDFEQAAALMGKFEKEGVNLETVMSGLRFALGKFAKAGLEPAQALRDVQAAILNAKTEAEATGIAFQTFGQRAAVDMSRAIIEGRFNIDELVTSLRDSRETINQAAADTLSLSERFTTLKNRVMTAVEPIARSLMDALERTLGVVERLTPLLEGLAKVFAMLPTSVQTVSFGLLALVAAAGPAVWFTGQLAIGAASVAKLFTTQGIAGRLLAGDLKGLGTSLAGAARGASLTAAAFVGWEIGRWIAGVFDLDRKIGDLTARLLRLGDVAAQTAGAKQDSINLAIQRGADATISYTEAIQFNEEWVRKRTDALRAAAAEEQRTVGATDALTDHLDILTAQLAAADAEIQDLSQVAREQLARALQSGAFSMEELEKATGLSSSALKIFKDRIEESTKSLNALTGAAAADSLRELQSGFRALSEEQQQSPSVVGRVLEAYEKLRGDLRVLPKDFEVLRLQVRGLAIDLARVEKEGAHALEPLGGQIRLVNAQLERIEAGSTDAIGPLGRFNVVVDGITQRMGPFGSEIEHVNTVWSDLEHGALTSTKALGPLGGAIELVKLRTDTLAASLTKLISEGLGPAILGAFQGGGDAGKSIGGFLGGGILSSVTGTMKDGLFAGGLGKVLQGTLGKTIGGFVGSIIPGLGTLLGGALGGLVGGLFGSRERDQVRDMTAEVLRLNGGFETLATRLHAATGSHEVFQRLMAARTTRDFEAAVRDVNAALAGLDEQLRTLGSDALNVTGKMGELRSLTPELEVALEGLFNAQSPQEYADALARVSRETDIAIQEQRDLDQSLKDLDLSWEVLGKTKRAEFLGQQFQDVQDDIDNVVKSGTDLNFTILSAGDKLSKLVQDAKRTGTEIPEALRPTLEQLAALGGLLDENGDLITDLSGYGVEFGGTFKKNTDLVVTAMERMVTVLEAIARHLGAIPPTIDTTVNVNYNDPGFTPHANDPIYGDDGLDPQFAASGGVVTPHGVQHFEHGGIVAPESIFSPRGTDTVPAMLSPGEVVLPEADWRTLAAERARPTTVNLTLNIDGIFSEGDLVSTVQRRVVPIIAETIEDNVAGTRTRFQEALG